MTIPTPCDTTIPSETDHSANYLEFLVKVGERQAVVTNQDIYNQKGALIARQGAAVDREFSRKLALHKLVKPLEDQIDLAKLLTGADILSQFERMCQSLPDVNSMHRHLGFQEVFAAAFTSRFPRVLAQKLTVLQHVNSAVMEQDLLCAWLAGLLAQEMNFAENKIQAVILAALCRDLGFLHLSPDLMDTQDRYTEQQWRAMQCHVVVGKMMILRIPGISTDQAEAILEHHERVDGSGYPATKTGEQLGPMGQILALADALAAIRIKKFQAKGRNLRDARVFLQINEVGFQSKVVQAAFSLLRHSALEPSPVASQLNISQLKTTLESQLAEMRDIDEHLLQVLNLLIAYPITKEKRELFQGISEVLILFKRSGVLRLDLVQWLQTVAEPPSPQDLVDLGEMELMITEFQWQLTKVRRYLESFLNPEFLTGLRPEEFLVLLKKLQFEQSVILS